MAGVVVVALLLVEWHFGFLLIWEIPPPTLPPGLACCLPSFSWGLRRRATAAAAVGIFHIPHRIPRR